MDYLSRRSLHFQQRNGPGFIRLTSRQLVGKFPVTHLRTMMVRSETRPFDDNHSEQVELRFAAADFLPSWQEVV
jgi:hypothetical protein